MDTLPQGLPQDTRDIVRRLRGDPHYGGPPASGPGDHPDIPRWSPFGTPLPNFPGLHWDNLPCHIPARRVRDTLYDRIDDESLELPMLDPKTYRVETPWKQLLRIKYLHYFASQQPLTVEPLADGSNILLAPEGSIESDFGDAFNWYARYLEWLHYESITDERVERLHQLRQRAKSFVAEQQKTAERRSNPVNGLFPIPPLLQDWIWPWNFFLSWEIRQELLVDDKNAPAFRQDMSIQILNKLMVAERGFEDLLMAQDEKRTNNFMPEDRFLPVLNIETEKTPLRYWTINDADEFIRGITRDANRAFHLKALRHWGFKRPWKKLWLVFNPQDMTDVEREQQISDGVIVEVQRRIHTDVYGSQLLTFHPLLARQLNVKADSCPLAACGGDPWQTEDQVVETECGHVACVECMINYWEFHVRSSGGTPQGGDWPCPFCRQTPGTLRSRVNIAHTQGLGADIDLIADSTAI